MYPNGNHQPHKESAMPSQTEIRQSITTKIIESLKGGKLPWRKPWTGIEGPSTPTNLVSKHKYSGVNTLLTLLAEMQHGWPVSYWATFNQFRQIGCHIRKGEKATTIVYWQQIKKTVTDRNGDKQEKTIPFLKTWSVFNISQADGEAVAQFNVKPELKTFEGVDRGEFDITVAATQARIDHGNEIAAYLPLEDRIIMPDEGRFDSFSDFAATTFHELSHWCQPQHRCNIQGSYAEGELFAEISSSFLMSATGIPHTLENTQAYVQSWIQKLENDPKFIFQASSAASKSADFILSFSRPQEESDSDVEAGAVISA